MVVIALAPLSIGPKPDVIEPESNAPVVTMLLDPVTGEIPDGATFRIRCLDASANNVFYWSVDNIPTTVLSSAENGDLPAGATANSSGFNGGEKANGWAGPCPPANTGIHNYTFTVRLVNSSGTQLAISNALVSAIPTD